MTDDDNDERRDNDHELASHPHDAFFKDFFSDLENATAFFKAHLPSDVAALLSWESLSLVPGSFAKRSLQQAA